MVAFHHKVSIDKHIGKIPHRQSGFFDMLPDSLATLQTYRGGNKPVSTATEALQMRASLGKIVGFIKPVIAAHQNLITTDNQSIKVVSSDFFRLQPRKLHRGRHHSLTGGECVALNRSFIDVGR